MKDAPDAGADTKVSSDGAPNNGSDDNDVEEVIVIIASDDFGDGNNNGTDVQGTDGDNDYDSGTFMKDAPDAGADTKVSSDGAPNNGSDDNDVEEVIVIIASDDFGDVNNNGTVVQGTDGDNDNSSGTFMKDAPDAGADTKVSSDGAPNNGSDDNDVEEVIVIIASDDFGDVNNNGTVVQGTDGDNDNSSGTFMKDAPDAGADTKVSSDGAPNNGSDDNDVEEVIVIIASDDFGDVNNNGTVVQGTDGDNDNSSGTFMKDAPDAGADTKVSSDGAPNNGSDDNDVEEVIVIIASDDFGDVTNNGTDVQGTDGDNDNDSGTFMTGPGDSSGVKGHQSAPVKV
ncbi:uncharacterized protein LOC144754142 [Lissotriton helveticus]